MAGHPPILLCLVCHAAVKVVDTEPIEDASGLGWRRRLRRTVTECPDCGTVRSRLRQEIEFDEGLYSKRSLR